MITAEKPSSTINSPLLSLRQRSLLAFLAAAGKPVGSIDFQKLLFLFCQENPSACLYEFVPYRFGAFSFTSYNDRRKLVKNGLLSDDEHRWQLTDYGCRAAGGMPDNGMTAFFGRYGDLRGDELIAETYRRYPFYATRSEIVRRVLHGDTESFARVESVRPEAHSPGLFTIGYEGYSVEGYLNTLLRAGVNILCDVRRNAISRKYGFSRTTLSKGSEMTGIRYIHLPDLGIASERRRSLTTQAEYDALFAEYERDTLPGQAEALAGLVEFIREGNRIALTCYEHLPMQCHRLRIADALVHLEGGPETVVHL